MTMRDSRTVRHGERGSALVEFLLCLGLFLVPLFLGTLVIGFNLVRAVQVTQVCRDAGHMYSYGIDFSLPAYQTLLSSLGPGLGITSSGNGVVVLTTMTALQSTDCNSCTNLGSWVITRQIVVGNSGIHASTFGTPPSKYVDSSGNVSTAGYLNDPACQANGFTNVISFPSSGQYHFAYVSEMWVNSPDYNWWPALGSPQVSARSIF